METIGTFFGIVWASLGLAVVVVIFVKDPAMRQHRRLTRKRH